MTFLAIDSQQCKHDGICVATCPMGILQQPDGNTVPTAVENAAELCIQCGHCVAVCPHGALSIDPMAAEQCAPLQKELSPSWEQVKQMLQGRRSVRSYKAKPVPRQVLTDLLDVVRYAPSGHNLQEVSWLVIHDPEQVLHLKELVIDWMQAMLEADDPIGQLIPLNLILDLWKSGVDKIGHGAPHLIVAHAPKNHPVALVDSTIGLTYLELAATGQKLGTCWAGAFHIAATRWPPLQEALQLPAENINQGAMMIGYPKYRYARIPQRNPAKIQWL